MAVSILGSITKSQYTATSVSHTVTSGTDVLYVLIGNRYTDGDIASVSWNGSSMTKVVGSGTPDFRVACVIFRTINPTATTANITWTNASSRNFFLAAVNLAGVDTTTPEEDTDFKAPSSTGTSSSLALTSQTGGLVLDVCAKIEDGVDDTWTIGGGQSDLYGVYDASYNPGVIGASSYEAGASSVTMSHSWLNSDFYSQAAIAVKPASGTSLFPLLGVG